MGVQGGSVPGQSLHHKGLIMNRHLNRAKSSSHKTPVKQTIPLSDPFSAVTLLTSSPEVEVMEGFYTAGDTHVQMCVRLHECWLNYI